MTGAVTGRWKVGGRYELEALPVAKGGMGEVWLGVDTKLDRDVAVKFLRFPDGRPDSELVRRFVRESRITARLEHPGVPAVHDVGTHEGRPYLVMQRVRGISLADVVAEVGPLPLDWAAAVAAQVCAVLAVAHRASLVHRDLKPGNLMLCPDGTVKVLDFGLAVALDLADASQITRTGQSLGTPAYMAPEQVLAATSGPRTDLYALGATLHEMIVGRPPFHAATAFAVMRMQVDAAPPRLSESRRDLPADLDELVAQLLAKAPEDRPDSADAVFARLLAHVGDLRPMPGFVEPGPACPNRMYAEVVARVTATASASPAESLTTGGAVFRPDSDTNMTPTPTPTPVPVPVPAPRISRGQLTLVRGDAEILVAESRFSQAVRGSDDPDAAHVRQLLSGLAG